MAESLCDLTTHRTAHFAAFRETHLAALLAATWWDTGDGYASTNVAPIGYTVTHFRAPLTGGPIEINALSTEATPWGAYLHIFPRVEAHGFDLVKIDDSEDAMHEYTVSGLTSLA